MEEGVPEYARLAAELLVPREQESRWYCDLRGWVRGRRKRGVEGCDGEPHEGWHWCEHPIVGHPGGDEHWRCRHARTAQHPPEGDWRIWMVKAGRAWGKALALDTAVPTPTGWTTMGAVQPGDEVFDELGRPCRVEATSPVQFGRACYRVTFGDGTEVVADADHEWLTSTHWRSPRRPECEPGVRTTEEIRWTLLPGPEGSGPEGDHPDGGPKGTRGDRNHSVAVTGALDLPEADLPIDPYILGCWLGDGSSACADLTTADEEHMMAAAEAVGYRIGRTRRRRAEAGCVTFSVGGRPGVRDPLTGQMRANGSLHSALRELGLLRNKHVPPVYLRASAAQRLALLQGLMDTDGCVSSRANTCEFSVTRRALADGAAEVATSLGFVVRRAEGRARLYGRDCGPVFDVRFRPTRPVFRLARKMARLNFAVKQGVRATHRMIVAVEPVPSVPVRCIRVASASHLFLATRAMIPTHNSRTGSEWLIHQALGRPGTTWAVVAASRDDLQATCLEGDSGLLRAAGMERLDPAYNRTALVLRLPNGSVIRGLSAERPERTRGPNLAGAWLDEFAIWRYRMAWDDLMPALRRGEARIVITTTPKPTPLMRELLAREDGSVVVTGGGIRDNLPNLSEAAVADLQRRWAGTRRGLQELEGEMLTDTPGALWTAERLEATRAVLREAA